MFEIVSKIYNGTTLVKYEVLDKNTNKTKVLSIETVQGLAMAGSLVNAKFNEKSRTLTGINGYDLRTLPKKQDKVKKNADLNSNIVWGDKLNSFIKKNTSGYNHERYLVSDIMSFLETSCKGKICALYGLRRTGKTVMMYHSIKRLLNKGINNIAFISLTENDSLATLYRGLESLIDKGIKYIFIDEITAVNGFVQSSALLADKYAKMGVHIVIAGTDSYIINIAGKNNLYDRMIRINTSYIGYKEYEYLNSNTSILEYIRIGGVLPADIFYNEDKTKDYINTAISNNIINSLVRANNKKEYKHLLELVDRGLLKKAIEQAIEDSNNELTTSVITQSYINGTLGSAMQLLEAVFDIDSSLDTEEVEDRIRYKLSIVKETRDEFSNEYIEELKDFLVEIGVIKMYSRYICTEKRTKRVEVPLFVQPGLRYNQTVALINSLCETSSFWDIPKNIREQLQQKIIEDVEGNLIEHEVILSELVKYAGKNIEVTQLSYESKEVDMLIHNDTTLCIFEIKRNQNDIDDQAKWLINAEINNCIEKLFGMKINKRIVLYLGEDKTKEINGKKVFYRNINNFLKS